MFTLINASGQEKAIVTKPRHAFDVSGMGFTRNEQYAQVGNRFMPIDDRYTQGSIGGSMRFAFPGYQDYYDFVRFTDNSPLKLKYENSNGTFFRDVILSEIDRKELVLEDERTIIFTLTALGLWYRVLTAINNGEQANGKIYTVDEQTQETIGYSYPYVYGESAGVLRIQSDSYEDSPAKLTIFGPVANPSWSHHANSEEIATGAVNATVLSGHKLVIDATVTPYSIKIFDMQNNLISDVYGLSNFATERFVILKQGSNVITVTGGGQVMIEGQISYAGV